MHGQAASQRAGDAFGARCTTRCARYFQTVLCRDGLSVGCNVTAQQFADFLFAHKLCRDVIQPDLSIQKFSEPFCFSRNAAFDTCGRRRKQFDLCRDVRALFVVIPDAFNAAISYAIPSPFADGAGKAIFSGFGLDTIVRARSATPVNVLSGRDPFGLGFTTVSRPDLVAGQPLYLNDPSFAGGRRFNPAAFDGTTPIAQGRQGTLGRNVLRGFSASQVDVALRRDFKLVESLNLQFRLDAFNLFNHANFANPTGILTSAIFGRASQMLSSGLGGMSPLYQIGGPRSLQLALKLQF